MSLPLANTFESGQSSGTTITTGNSGGAAGDAFDIVSIGGTGTVTYDNVHIAQGLLAAKFVCDATTGAGVTTDYQTKVGTPTEIWGRFYLYITAQLAAGNTFTLFGAERSGVGACGLVNLTPFGGVTTRIQVENAVSTKVNTGIDVPLNQWVRVEFHMLLATSGQVDAKLWTDPLATTGENTATVTGDTRGFTDRVYFGNRGMPSATGYTHWMDGIHVNATGYPGPLVAGRTRPYVDVTISN
jgi:hypothetical protein